MDSLAERYSSAKTEIERRLKEFEVAGKKSDRKIFIELAFCILTPQSKAKVCDAAVKKLLEKNLLYDGTEAEIRRWLAGVRFPNAKARHMVAARDCFFRSSEKILSTKNNPKELREWLVENVLGLGYKEASHFLRNIGLGEELAILDRHILKNLVRHSVIKEIPKTLTKKRYLEIEERMKEFSVKTGIPLSHLDLLFWSEETGEMFK